MDNATLTVRDYLQAILRRRWLVVVMVAAAVGAVLIMTALQPAIYSSEAQILVEPRAASTVFEQDRLDEPLAQNLDRAIQTEIRVIEGQEVRRRVQQDLALDQLPPEVSAQALGATDVVSLVVRSEDAQTAQILADAYVESYMSIRREQVVEGQLAAIDAIDAELAELQASIDAIDAELAGGPDASLDAQRQALVNQQSAFNGRLGELQVDTALTTGGVSYVRAAELPDDPVAPTPKRNLILAVIAGLVLGVGAALLVDYLDESLESADDVIALEGPPVLAVIPVEPPPDARPIALSEPGTFAVESYRGLRTNLLFLALDAPLGVIQLTSALPGEGKTTTASNLAVVLGAAGKRVIVVDADLRKPRLHDVFGAAPVPGLTEVALGYPVDDAVRPVADGVHLLSAGAAPANPGELLLNPRLHQVLRDLADRYDHVLVDSPPVLPVADAVALSRAVDGVLVIAQAGRTTRRSLSDTLGRLDQVDARVLGVVLNRASTGRAAYQGYGYGYSGGYGSNYAAERGLAAVDVHAGEASPIEPAVAAEHDPDAPEPTLSTNGTGAQRDPDVPESTRRVAP